MTLTTSLSREYVFEGKALYTKQVDIPEEWDGTSVRLVMERTKPTTIWIDGKEVGANNDISTAQQYDLSSYLFPGTHTVAILVDNGKQAVPEKVYGSSHAYSASTQTNWNGIIGDFYLESVPLCGIDDIQLYPDVAKKVVTARVTLRNPDKGVGKGILSFMPKPGIRINSIKHRYRQLKWTGRNRNRSSNLRWGIRLCFGANLHRLYTVSLSH